MARGYSPTIRRIELGILLRRYRTDRGLTASQVALATDINASQISRLETAQRAPVIPYVEKLCVFYELDASTTIHLVRLARESRRDGWWQQYDLEPKVASYVSLESAARSIDTFESLVIPGLLQTPEYMTAVISQVDTNFTSAYRPDIDQAVEARKQRQMILTGDDRVRLHTVIDEATLHRNVGGAEVMRAQLLHLLETGAQDNITIQVLPFSAATSPGLDGMFTLLNFSLDIVSTVLYVEGQMGYMVIEKEEDIARCQRTFTALSEAAADAEKSAEIIRKAIKSLTR